MSRKLSAVAFLLVLATMQGCWWRRRTVIIRRLASTPQSTPVRTN